MSKRFTKHSREPSSKALQSDLRGTHFVTGHTRRAPKNYTCVNRQESSPSSLMAKISALVQPFWRKYANAAAPSRRPRPSAFPRAGLLPFAESPPPCEKIWRVSQCAQRVSGMIHPLVAARIFSVSPAITTRTHGMVAETLQG
jgi:hypothetical protein